MAFFGGCPSAMQMPSSRPEARLQILHRTCTTAIMCVANLPCRRGPLEVRRGRKRQARKWPCYNPAAPSFSEQEVNTLADQLSLFSAPETRPTHVVICDFHPETDTLVVLAQAPIRVPAPKNRPAFFRHKPGRNPQIEAKAIARYLGEKHHDLETVVMA